MENHFQIYSEQFKTRDIKLSFDYRAAAQCRLGCTRYKNKPTCPPNIPDIKFYSRVLREYENLAIVARKYPYSDSNFHNYWRNYSTNEIHSIVLQKESELFKSGHMYAKAFIGGSCKMCASGCNPLRCNMPNRGRTPIEATGLNVFLLMNTLGLDFEEPPKNYFWRLGVIFF